MEGKVNLYEFTDEKTRIEQVEWAQKLFKPLNLKQKDNPKTTEEIISDETSCPSPLHGVFFNALIHLPTSTYSTDERISSHQQILNQIMAKDVNKGVQSMVSELIQNSVDMGAGRISIEISEEHMTFTHDGSNDDGTIFTPKQLSYLFSMNTSTKMGDFTKIGQFGVGFKYWWWFFEEVEVIVDDGKFHHNLSLTWDFEPHKTEYTYKASNDTDASFTKFVFTKPRKDKTQKVKWTEYVKNEGTDIYGERVFRSLPFIQSRTGSDFEINLKSPITTSKLFCKLKNSENCDGFVLDTIEWGRSKGSEEPEISTNYRVSTNLNELKKSDKSNFDKFRNYVIDAYRDSKTLQKLEAEDFEKVIAETADKAIQQSKINLLITPNESFTYPANLFVANSIDSKMSCAFYSDAPWQMEQNRVKLNMDTETPKRAWNFIMARFVDRLYSRFMSKCLKDSNNLGFNAKEMFELINRPIGSSSILSNEPYPLDERFRVLYSVLLDDKEVTLGHRINHIRDTFSLTDREFGVAGKPLTDLWFKLLKNEPGNEKARKWLYQALHENLAKVRLAKNEFVPVTITNSFAKLYESQKSYNPPVICRNIGKGIPRIIKDMLHKSNIADYEPIPEDKIELWKNQLLMFDDIISDSKKQLYFANDGERIICDVPVEDELNLLTKCLNIVETESNDLILYFLSNNFKNVKQHKSHLGESKHSLPKALDFEKAMEKLLLHAYELSLKNDAFKESPAFKQWLNDNTSTRVWNDVLLLKTRGEEYPILVKMPPKAHMLCVVIGLNGKRHLESIKTDPLDHTEPGIVFHENKPKIFHWGKNVSEHVYVTPDYLGPIENLFNPWQSDKKTPSLDDSENWGWSDLSPNGDTGWSWPQVSIDIDDSEIKANVISRITPVFVDGLHVRQETTFSGVHLGLRIVDGENNIITSSKASRLPIAHMASGPSKAENAIEVVQLNFITKSKVESFDLLANSIDHIIGSKYYPYRTTQKGNRVMIKHAVSRGDKEFGFNLKPHGQIRVLGLLSAIIEKYNFRSENESEKQISFHNLQAISQRLESYNIRNQNLDHIFDVPLVRGGTEKRKERLQIGLVGIFIPHHKFETRNYLDDTGKTRLRESDRFEELRGNGLSGYFTGSLSKPNNVKDYIHEEYKAKVWLPRYLPELESESSQELVMTSEKYGIETVPIYDWETMVNLMQYKLSRLAAVNNRALNDSKYDLNKDRWAYRWGLNQLLHIISKDGSAKSFALDWLEHLLKHQLPMNEWSNTSNENVWNKPKLGVKPKEILQKGITGLEDSYPMIAKLCAHEDEIDLWPDFLVTSLVGSDAKKELRDRRDTRLRKMQKSDNGYWEPIPSDVKFDHLKKMDETKKLDFIVSDLRYFSQQIVSINDDMEIFYCPSQDSQRKAWKIINEINPKAVNEINLAEQVLGTHFEKEQKLLAPPNHFKYLNDLVTEIFPKKKIIWYAYSETKSQNNIVAGEGCVAIEVGDEYLHIRSNKSNLTLSTNEHNFLTQMLIDFLHSKVQINDEKLESIIQQSLEHFPEQIYKILGLDFTLEHRYQFISNYCQGELNFARFQRELKDVDDDESLKNLLEVLKKKYREEDIQLQDKELFLRQLYENIPSIIQDRNSFTGISNPNNPMTVTRTRSIGHNMVSQMTLKTPGKFSFIPNITGTLGNTLLVNALEFDWFGRHVARHDTGEQYDFCEHALKKMEEALFAQWFNPNTEFVTVDQVFVDQDQKRFAGKFHRIHLIHIIASLYVYVEVEE